MKTVIFDMAMIVVMKKNLRQGIEVSHDLCTLMIIYLLCFPSFTEKCITPPEISETLNN